MENPIEGIKDFAGEKVEVSLDKLESTLKKYELQNIHSDFAEKMGLLIIASFGIITAVSWDQVLKLIAIHFFEQLDDIWVKLFYALFVTVLTVIVSIIVNQVFTKRRAKVFDKDIVEILRDVLKK